MILNVKDDGRIGQKWHQLTVIDIYSVGLDRQRSTVMVLTAARYMLKSFMADIVVARLWMRCQGHVAHGTSRLYLYAIYKIYFVGPLPPLVIGLPYDHASIYHSGGQQVAYKNLGC